MHLCPQGEGILATPEYEIHGFQIPYHIFQASNLRGDFLATCKFRSCCCFQRPRPNRSDDKNNLYAPTLQGGVTVNHIRIS